MNVQPVHAGEFVHKPEASAEGMSNYVETLQGATDGLPGVFAMGHIGLYHDWCYMFPTYPHAFDLVHVRDLQVAHSVCKKQAVLDIDRLLRPGGYIVLSGNGLAAALTEEAVRVLGWAVVPSLNVTTTMKVVVMRKLAGTFKTVGEGR